MKRFVLILIVAAMLASIPKPVFQARAQASPGEQAKALLKRMTPEERVGQLFLVTFQGHDISAESQVYSLIVQYNVGGVVLLAENGNFAPAPNTVPLAYELVAGLQKIEADSALEPLQGDKAGEAPARNYIPLFAGISQPGDGLPFDQILSGLAPLPPAMALGATWTPDFAEQTGAQLGSQLAALGFNLYLGPTLDVISNPRAVLQDDPGTSAFGGDPFWVGKFGQYYTRGLHTGGNGRMAVVARNFPGRGEADRPAQAEVATVRKSLEQLKQIELAPFFAVTGDAPDPSMSVDGLLVSHIRYQGFQGNIRATTRPISFDQQAFGLIMGLEPLTSWRASGGLMVSDDLGTRAVSRFYDPTGENFSANIVARDAFLAGNDLLYTGNILSSDQQDTYQSVVAAMNFFAQKYREDSAFAARVDESVLRILTLKFKLYSDFAPESVIPPVDGIAGLGTDGDLTGSVSRQAVTLISPDSADLATVLPDAPGIRDRIVFVTDYRTGKQCPDCADQAYMEVDALESTVLRLYGPQGGGQVLSSRMNSFSFDDLAALLQGSEEQTDFDNALSSATWVVISTLDLPPGESQTLTLSRFLTERASQLRDKKVILFSFAAPYYLDATDISKLTAYYCIYGKSQDFIESAARVLFKEITILGDSPVSVPGTGYDLIEATSPFAGQVIQLYNDLPPAPTPVAGSTLEPTSEIVATLEPTAIPLFTEGSAFYVRTGVVVDNNGNPVPDGTVVNFVMKVEGGIMNQVPAETLDGVAQASFRLDQAGLVEISATSEPATTSIVLQIDVTPGEAVAVTVIAPTQQPTPYITPSPTPTLEPTPPSSTMTVEGYPLMPAWFLSMLLIIFGSGIVYIISRQLRPSLWALRWAICVLLGGLAGYNYIAFGLPGSLGWVTSSGFNAVLSAIVIGMLSGLAGGVIWERLSQRKKGK